MFSFLLPKHPEAELLERMVGLCLLLHKTAKLFSKMFILAYISQVMWEFYNPTSNCSTPSSTFGLSVFVPVFLMSV
jgi:hypothetical protein